MNMQFGLIGLGTMGANLARNAARNGAKVVVYNRTAEKTDSFMSNHASEGNFIAAKTLPEFVVSLESPRPIVLMVKAGEAVDAMINELLPHIAPGDILIDAGNSHYKDTDRRIASLKEKGIHFIGMGVSGGEEGALLGPSMMPGGDKAAYESLAPLLIKMSADDGMGGKCVSYVGAGGTGHYVKMVHNGIEYGIMQLIAEAYDLLKRLGGLSNAELGALFTEWSTSEDLRGFLMEITAKTFTQKDAETGKDLIDVIKDAAGQKGTGKWTTEAAFNYGVAVPTITAGIDARIMSSAKDFRSGQSKASPLQVDDIPVDRDELIKNVRIALELSMMNAYAQGFQLMSVPSQQESWNLNIPEIARTWRGGCIIRSSMVEFYQRAFSGDRSVLDEMKVKFGKDRQIAWRHVVALGALRGIPLPAMSASLSYYDSYRTERLPQNLIQAQRDFFGAHTFERLDKEGSFHVQWGQ
jgi:6-phosphogluconate dehydrogenase